MQERGDLLTVGKLQGHLCDYYLHFSLQWEDDDNTKAIPTILESWQCSFEIQNWNYHLEYPQEVNRILHILPIRKLDATGVNLFPKTAEPLMAEEAPNRQPVTPPLSQYQVTDLSVLKQNVKRTKMLRMDPSS